MAPSISYWPTASERTCEHFDRAREISPRLDQPPHWINGPGQRGIAIGKCAVRRKRRKVWEWTRPRHSRREVNVCKIFGTQFGPAGEPVQLKSSPFAARFIRRPHGFLRDQ